MARLNLVVHWIEQGLGSIQATKGSNFPLHVGRNNPLHKRFGLAAVHTGFGVGDDKDSIGVPQTRILILSDRLPANLDLQIR